MTTIHQIPQPADLVGAIAEAWRAQDADHFASVFCADGSMTLPGVFLQGRETIGAFMKDAFAGPYRGTQVVGSPVAVRALSDEVILIHTVGGVRGAGQTELPAGSEVNATWVAIRRAGGWQLASYQNTPRST